MSLPYIDVHSHRPAKSSLELVRIESVRLCDSSARAVEPCTLSLHPWYAEDMTDDALGALADRLDSSEVVGIGEVGLDRLSAVPLALQIRQMQAVISLANARELPLVVHCVRAWSELLALKRQHAHTPWIIHGYRRGAELATELMEVGCFLSFGRRYNLEALRLAYDRGALLLETDDESDLQISEHYASVAHTLGISLAELLASTASVARLALGERLDLRIDSLD